MHDARGLFDPLADHYHLLYDNWEDACQQQGKVISAVLSEELNLPEDAQLLDATCGIGTQVLGLAGRGHSIAMSDQSEVNLRRAQMEGARLGYALDGKVADLCRLTDSWQDRVFDAVLCLDNALPNLLSEAALQDAVMQIGLSLKPGGWFVASMRDYDGLIDRREAATPLRVIDDAYGRRLLFQTWDWRKDEPLYHMTQYLIVPASDGARARTMTFSGWFRALRRREVNRALRRAGFENILWLGRKKTGFFQPLLIAQLPSRMHG
jgi:SAM-dependent methyltransferase|tara:strand:+ start:10052 stop:10846 length:795 start_codon:yes stop_codon:yes gene_type:complete